MNAETMCLIPAVLPDRDVDIIVNEGLKNGHVPEHWQVSRDARGLALGGMAVLGLIVDEARMGSTATARRTAGLEGPRSGTKKENLKWLPNEFTTAVKLAEYPSAAALVVAAEILEHNQPDTVVSKSVRAARRAVGGEPGESEPAKNNGEQWLLRTANLLIEQKYGQEHRRNTPGSVAPMLMALAVEASANQLRETRYGTDLVVATLKAFRQSWDANYIHHGSYPAELEILSQELMKYDLHVAREGQGEAIATAVARNVQLIQEGRRTRPLTPRELASAVEHHRTEVEKQYLLGIALGYSRNMARKRQASAAVIAAEQQTELQQQARANVLREDQTARLRAYGTALLEQPAALLASGVAGLQNGRPDEVLRKAMALYEQGAIAEFHRLWADGYDEMFTYVQQRQDLISDGYVGADEALFITLVYADTERGHHLPVTEELRLQQALEEATFKQKEIESNTGEGDELHPSTVTTWHPGIYSSAVREFSAAVLTRDLLIRSTRLLDQSSLSPAQVVYLNSINEDRWVRIHEQLEAMDINDQDMRAVVQQFEDSRQQYLQIQQERGVPVTYFGKLTTRLAQGIVHAGQSLRSSGLPRRPFAKQNTETIP